MISPLPVDVAEPVELVQAMRNRRGGNLLKLDRMLLHSPPLAEGWNVYLGKIRNSLEVPYRLRELVMCVVAVLNGATYEYEHHAPLYVDAGASKQQADALKALATEDPFPEHLFPRLDQDVIALTRQMTVQIKVEPDLKQRLVDQIGPRQTVELVGVVATYNMVSRFLVALDVHTEEAEANNR
jgi:alkylhydroperoxidase family enzyme